MNEPKTRQLFTKLFWLDAIERVIATFVEALAAVITVAVMAGNGFEAVNWVTAISIAGLASVLSLLKAMYAAAKADTDTASLTVDTKTLK